eukprot:gene27223-2474_t
MSPFLFGDSGHLQESTYFGEDSSEDAFTQIMKVLASRLTHHGAGHRKNGTNDADSFPDFSIHGRQHGSSLHLGRVRRAVRRSDVRRQGQGRSHGGMA